MQLSGPLAFIVSASVAGMLNRSLMLVPLLALTATGVSVLMRKLIPSMRAELQSVLQPGAPVVVVPATAGAVRGFFLRWLGYGFVFLSAAMLAALFQITEFEPRLQTTDLWFLCIPAAIAMPSRLLAHHLGIGRAANIATTMQGVFKQNQPVYRDGRASEGDPFTVEGEIIEPDSAPNSKN